jgi:hypothetical protein
MSKRRRPGAGRRLAEQRFWGTDGSGPNASDPAGSQATVANAETHAEPEPSSAASIRPTTDPAAVVRSLGPPPLAIDSGAVERHLTAVYEEAVRAATALAAANGLLASDDENAADG